MRRPYKILMAILVLLGLVFVGWFFLSGDSGNPRLAISYLSETNDSGRLIALFAVTNTGNSPAVSSGVGTIEFPSNKTTQVACRTSMHRLLPGKGDIIQVFPTQNPQGPWRFTAFYAHDGARSRIYDLQWGPHGLGARINWLVPRPLKGVLLDVVATSAWIGDAPPTNTAVRPTSISIEPFENPN